MDSSRGGGNSKRTVSDNSRAQAIEQRQTAGSVGGIKVLIDKTNNMSTHLGPSGNSFVIKRPTTQMATERATNVSAICSQQEQDSIVTSARRGYSNNMGQGTSISNYKIVK